jgi:hypothetical protein
MHCRIVTKEENAQNKYIELITKYNNSLSRLQYSVVCPLVWFRDTNVLAAFTFRIKQNDGGSTVSELNLVHNDSLFLSDSF